MPSRSVPERILHSAMEVISDFGVRRFTVDELARRVGLSRVTIYRHFESKREVLEATMLHQLAAFIAGIEAAVAGYEHPEQRVVEGFVRAVADLRAHPVLQRLLRTEPELILPLLTTQGGPVIEAGRRFITDLAGEDGATLGIAAPRLEVVAEILSRWVLSLVLTPASVVPLDREEDLRAYTQEYVGSVLRAFSSLPTAH